MMVLEHGASFSEVHVRRFPSTVLLSRNPEGIFPHPTSRDAFNPESCSDFSYSPASRVSNMGNFGSRKPIGGLLSGTTRPGIRLRAPNYEAFLKISIN